jgi:uncharacterized protein YegL
MSALSAPSEFLCPITQEIMIDPVVGTDGHTYERDAIVTWLAQHATSPQTRQHMTVSNLAPNWALKNLIADFLKTAAGSQAAAAARAAKAAGVASAVPVQFNASVSTYDGNSYLTLGSTSVKPMETVIIAIVDTSGSMASGAAPPDTKASAEAAVFSRLDLVKHCMKTVAAVAASRASESPVSLSIIGFSESANCLLPLTKMKDHGLDRANAAISALYEGGGTNIYAGLAAALEEARKAATASPNANIQIVLLTDGEPTPDYIPHGGITPAFKRKLAESGVKANLSTFGFGYSLESKLLESLSVEGAGTYGFIPDCSMVGTVFINFCSTVLSTVANHISVSGKYIGSLSAGQTRTVKVSGIMAGDTVEVMYGNQTATVVVQAGTEAAALERAALDRVYAEVVRCCSVRHDESFRSTLTALHSWISAALPESVLKKDILRDILSEDENEGQLMRAVSKKEWFDRWGLNHLISYSRALACEQTVNFKDAVLQHFCGDLFRAIQDRGNALFADLPPPRSSITPHVRVTGQYMSQTSNNASGGCFGGNCMVEMEDGGGKLVSLVQKGDILASGFVVQAVVKTELTAPVTTMIVFPEGLTITPYHPIKEEESNEWVFPADIGMLQDVELDAYYNFVLDSGHMAVVDGIAVCTLGHGLEGPVIGHPYFGTQKVIEDLKGCDGWDEGLIVLDPASVARDPQTGLVCSF